MRPFHTLLLCATITLQPLQRAAGQVSVRAYYETFGAAGPLIDRVTALQNGDILYYDQLWNTIARIDPSGNMVWYRKYDLTGVPTQLCGVAHVAETLSGELVVAMTVADAGLQFHPVLMRLDANGTPLSTKVLWGTTVGLADYLRVASMLFSGEIRMVVRGTGDGGTLHAFDATGTPLWSKQYTNNSELPVEMTQSFGQLVGANVGRLVQYNADGTSAWVVTPGFTMIGADSYFTFIEDVVPIPIGSAFAFVASAAGTPITVGIGLMSASGIFQGAIIFNVAEQQFPGAVYDRPRLAAIPNGLAMVANNGGDPGTGYVFTCAQDLTNTQVYKVEYGEQAFPRSIATTSGGGVAISGRVVATGVGQRLIVTTETGADVSSCFAPTAFTVTPYPMATFASVAIAGIDVTATWTDQPVILTDPVFDMDFLCGVGAIAESGAGQGVTIAPSPARDLLTLTWPNEEQLDLRVVDLAGREVRHERLTSGQATFSVATLADGPYVLHARGVGSQLESALRFVVAH